MHKASFASGPEKRSCDAVKYAGFLTRMYIMTASLLFLFFAVSPVVIGAEEAPRPVNAKLVSDVSAVKPGTTFEMGVLFEVEPGWHIYWKNPGDSGLPTSVKLTVPEGFKTDEIVWPIPHVFNSPGGIVDYGYEDSLLLASVVTAPEDIPAGKEAEFKANASWVSCKEVCIPGRSELVITLPVSEDAKSINKELFAKWRDLAPSVLASDKSDYGIDVELKEDDDRTSNVVIFLNSGNDVKEIEMYPGPSESLVVENISVEPDAKDGKTSITFDVKKLKNGDSSLPHLETLIVFTDAEHKRSGVVVPLDLETTE